MGDRRRFDAPVLKGSRPVPYYPEMFAVENFASHLSPGVGFGAGVGSLLCT